MDIWNFLYVGLLGLSFYIVSSLQIKLGVAGWKERYYEEKFYAKSPEEMESIRKDVVSCIK